MHVQGVSSEQEISAAPADHLAGTRRGARQDHIRGLCLRKGITQFVILHQNKMAWKVKTRPVMIRHMYDDL